MNRRLYRSRTDSILGGVAGGVAEYLDMDPSIVRIVWAILGIVTGGIFVVLYVVMWIVVPESPGPMPAGPGPEPATGEPATGEPPAAAAEGAGPTVAPTTWSAGHQVRHRRGSGGTMVFGLILVGLGVWFLIDEYVPWLDRDLLWPVGLVVLGILLLVVAMRRPAAG